jgi:hypothetical protein
VVRVGVLVWRSSARVSSLTPVIAFSPPLSPDRRKQSREPSTGKRGASDATCSAAALLLRLAQHCRDDRLKNHVGRQFPALLSWSMWRGVDGPVCNTTTLGNLRHSQLAARSFVIAIFARL